MTGRKRKSDSPLVNNVSDIYSEISKIHHSLIMGNRTEDEPVSAAHQELLMNLTLPRNQMLTLIQNYLNKNGFQELAQKLSCETQIPLYNDSTKKLVFLIMNREFVRAVESIDSLFPHETPENKLKIKRSVLGFCFMEISSTRCAVDALYFVRKFKNSLKLPEEDLRRFAQIIVDPKVHPYDFEPFQDAKKEDILTDIINVNTPATVCLEEDRLTKLVKTAIIYQFYQCPFHSHFDVPSLNYTLFRDHFCSNDILPTHIIQTITTEQKSLWDVEYSNNGQYFVVTGQEKNVIIYKFTTYNNTYVKRKTFNFEALPMAVKWSENDEFILVITSLARYSIYTCLVEGENTRDLIPHTVGLGETPAACAWLKESTRFIVSTLEGNIYVMNHNSEILQFLHGYRITSMVYQTDSTVIFADTLKRILVWDIDQDNIKCLYTFETTISCIHMCGDRQHILVNLPSQDLILLSLISGCIRRRYRDIMNKRSFVKCSFMPGRNSKIFACGSEDGKIHFFNVDYEKNIALIPVGIDMAVSAVSWNPADPQTLLSAQVDGTLHIWKSSYYSYQCTQSTFLSV